MKKTIYVRFTKFMQEQIILVKAERRQKESTYCLILVTLTTDPVFRLFHDEDYSIV